MAYLIACSAQKQTPHEPRSARLEDLYMNDHLYQARRELIRLTGIRLDWDYTLPAWELYSYGRIYQQVEDRNWIKPSTDVKILSTLFGWVRHTDLLPIYELQMRDSLRASRYSTVLRYWQSVGELWKGVDSRHDIDLLFNSSREAIHGNSSLVAQSPNVRFRDNYGTGKGRWLNEQLAKF